MALINFDDSPFNSLDWHGLSNSALEVDLRTGVNSHGDAVIIGDLLENGKVLVKSQSEYGVISVSGLLDIITVLEAAQSVITDLANKYALAKIS